jgi:hypothetical protein
MITNCEICGGVAPEGHRFCDNCWADKAIEMGKAALCQNCQTPKVIEKLHKTPEGILLCSKCFETKK